MKKMPVPMPKKGKGKSEKPQGKVEGKMPKGGAGGGKEFPGKKGSGKGC